MLMIHLTSTKVHTAKEPKDKKGSRKHVIWWGNGASECVQHRRLFPFGCLLFFFKAEPWTSGENKKNEHCLCDLLHFFVFQRLEFEAVHRVGHWGKKSMQLVVVWYFVVWGRGGRGYYGHRVCHKWFSWFQFSSIQLNSALFVPHWAITLRWAHEENKRRMDDKLRQGYEHCKKYFFKPCISEYFPLPH